jgi:hypothetical protein
VRSRASIPCSTSSRSARTAARSPCSWQRAEEQEPPTRRS